MKRLIIIGMTLLLLACSKPLTNDQILAEVRKCEEAGLDVRLQYGSIIDDFTYGLVFFSVQCVPRGGSK